MPGDLHQKGVPMKTTSLCAALVIGLFLLPQAGLAKMVSLSDDRLSEVIGQAGIANEAIHASFDSHFDNIPAFNGILNFGDVTIRGSIDIRNPDSMNISLVNTLTNPALPGLGLMGLGGMGLGTHEIDMTTHIDQFSIGAIRVGQDLTGPALGSLDILDMHVEVKGTVSITSR